MADKSLNADQVRLLTEVMARTTPSLKPHEWNDVASKLGIGNGKAAKERFRYLMNSLTGSPSKATKSKAAPSTPKKTATTPSTPSRKRKNGDEVTASTKKAKIKPVRMKSDIEDGEEEEEEEEEGPATFAGSRHPLTTQEKQELEENVGDTEFSFFDHALYHQDQI